MASRTLAQKPGLLIPASLVSAPSPPDGISPLTRKYDLPPRPRPGRKRATDTPPTRRQAQNRAAQRAFRERKAAKVDGLEDEMNELRKEHEEEIAELRKEYGSHLRDMDLFYKNTIKNMTDQLASWRDRFPRLEASIAETKNISISDEDAQRSYHTPPTIQDGCGRCTIGSHCQCVEEAFDVNIAAESKRPLSPANSNGIAKRPRTMEQEELETDFTTFRPLLSAPQEDEVILQLQDESCGFCSDGSACLCAEIAADQALSIDTTQVVSSVSTTESTCANGPGTCDRCRSDPTISIMCYSLNATQPPQFKLPSRDSTKAIPCALGQACCRVSDTIANIRVDSSQNQTQAITGPTLSCADAFSALSQHKAFDRASKDLGDWLPILKTVSTGHHAVPNHIRNTDYEQQSSNLSIATNMANRTGFEIEAASVLSVLQFYDSRYITNEL